MQNTHKCYAYATPKLPFTDGRGGESHAQREYVHCLGLGIGFAAHGQYWHYKFAKNEGRTLDTKTRKVSAFNASGLDWTGSARKALRGAA